MDFKVDETKYQVITCPYCGAQYVPAEIYMPEDLVGRTDSVIKDPLGKLMYVDYQEDHEQDLIATYRCDHCDHDFTVEASITFKSKKVDEALDFTNTSSSLLD